MSQETATATTSTTAAPVATVTTATAAPAVVTQDATASTAVDPTLAEATSAYVDRKAARLARSKDITAKEPTPGERVAAKVEPTAAEAPAAEVVAPPAAAEAAKEEPKKEDEVPAALAQYLRDKRAVGKRAAEVEKEKASLAEQRSALEAERKATTEQIARAKRVEELKASNPIKAIEEMFGTDALKGTLAFDLLARSAELSGEAEPTPERIAESAAARAKLEIMQEIKADEDAKAKAKADSDAKAEEARRADNARGKEAFFVGLDAQFDEVRDQYPFLSSDVLSADEVDEFMAGHFGPGKTNQLPTPDAIFKHFEDVRERAAEKHAATLARKRGTTSAQSAPAKPSPAAAIVRGATVDTRGRVTAAIPSNESPSQRRDRIAREIDASMGR
jgi:hypothetical protein